MKSISYKNISQEQMPWQTYRRSLSVLIGPDTNLDTDYIAPDTEKLIDHPDFSVSLPFNCIALKI